MQVDTVSSLETVPESIAEAMASASDGLPQDELLGNCPYNARRLSDELKSVASNSVRNITIIRGGLDLPNEPTPQTVDDLPKYGVAHWWVEALIKTRETKDSTEQTRSPFQWFTLDLASEHPPFLGRRLITKERPSSYIPFSINPPDSDMFDTRPSK